MIRVAELLGSLSLATDLADGFALQKSLRTTVLAVRLARAAGAPGEVVRLCYWSSLLRFTGCTAFAYEEGRHFAAGDDISLRKALAMVDFGRPVDFLRKAVKGVAPLAPARQRLTAIATLLATPSAPRAHARAQCEAGVSFANTSGMPEVGAILRYRDERWDGRGPRKLVSEEGIPLPARVADVADVAELFAWNFGESVALEELSRRRGGSLDPKLTDCFVDCAGELFRDVFGANTWELFLESEPAPERIARTDEEIEGCLEAFARMADLASPFTLGHSRKVADLAAAAARALGVDDAKVCLARHAGLVHDLGRVAIPLRIWDKPGPLTPFEAERVRAHSHHTETVLALAPALEEVSRVATATHERGAGGGYHRRARMADLPPVARLLGAADVFVALNSDRAHRPKFARGAAESELRAMAASGALDPSAVSAVLEASGAAPRLPRSAPSALTPREIEVARLVAIGRTNPEIGKLLGMSPRTAQRHVMNIYEKLGLESRAGLALFALEHGLLD